MREVGQVHVAAEVHGEPLSGAEDGEEVEGAHGQEGDVHVAARMELVAGGRAEAVDRGGVVSSFGRVLASSGAIPARQGM